MPRNLELPTPPARYNRGRDPVERKTTEGETLRLLKKSYPFLISSPIDPQLLGSHYTPSQNLLLVN
jgi:hypothetical protein